MLLANAIIFLTTGAYVGVSLQQNYVCMYVHMFHNSDVIHNKI